MGKYSETIGSFIRTGNYPLEANYIFENLEQLQQFYSDPLNKATIHSGLLRIVENDENGQALYWAYTKEDGTLEFDKLIDYSTLDGIDELKEKLEQEINDRIAGDRAIWGTIDPTEIQADLNSILKLSEAIIDLRKEVEDLHSKDEELHGYIKSLAGTTLDDITEYLKTLNYQNLTKVSETLHYFLDSYDETKDTIDTWPELQAFLEGFGDSDTLLQILTDLWHNIQGDPLPNTPFRTLRGIQDFVEELKSYSINRMNNIQTELDQTQVGVGLSGDGAYNADKETYHLKDATSVMNALKILDSLINEAINNCNIQPEDTESVDMTIIKEPTKTTISAKVKLSSESGNDIITKNDGIYHNIDSEYENGILTIKVNGNIRKQHVLGISTLVEDGKYDPDQEAIVIVFKLLNGEKQVVTIPVSALIKEWEIDNSISTKVVELERVRVIAGGADRLSADVRISTNKYNILEKDANTLLVRGTADNIVYDGDVTVKSKLDSLIQHDSDLDNSVNNLQTDLREEIARAKEAERVLTDNLNDEIKRSTDQDTLLTNTVNSEIQRAKDSEASIQEALNSEIERSNNADLQHDRELHQLEDLINTETTRATHAEEQLDYKYQAEIDTSRVIEQQLSTKLNDEIKRSIDKDNELSTNLQNEITRATQKENDINTALSSEIERAKTAEATIQSNLDNEVTRATDKENLLDHKIDDLRDYLDSNFDKDSELTDRVTSLESNLADEINRAKLAEQNLDNKITTESERAINQETLLDHKISDVDTKLDNEIARAIDIENQLNNTLQNEITRSTTEDTRLNRDITDEITRAKQEEQKLQNTIDIEVTRATNAETLLDHKLSDLDTKLDNEIKRATDTEDDLQNQINNSNQDITDISSKLDAEIQRSTTKDQQLDTKIDSEISRAISVEDSISKEISDLINKCIVEGATTADEAYQQLAKLGSDYNNIASIGKTLKDFLEENDFADATINKWKELENFLSGITDQDTLTGILQNITAESDSKIQEVVDNLNSEINRAKEAEKTVSDNLSKEVDRATSVENSLDKAIKDETVRATNAENSLKSSIDSEIDRATKQEEKITNKLDSEITRSTAEDARLDKALSDEIVRAKQSESDLQHNIDLEKTRAESAESNLNTKIETIQTVITETINTRIDTIQNSLNQEISRAVQKDAEVDDKINDININLNNEITRATSAENVINSKIQNIESQLGSNDTVINNVSQKLQDEITRSVNQDTELDNKITNEVSRATAAEKIIEDNLSNHIKDYNNPHKVTAAQLGVYTKDEINDKIADLNSTSNGTISDINKEIDDLQDELNLHIKDYSNPHKITKAQIGLDKVDNTTDLEKPISVAMQGALNTINIELSQKAEATDFTDHIIDNTNPHKVTKEQVGLSNVDNTSDMNKPISLATQIALDKKSDIGHKHVMSDIEDLENLPIVKGFVNLLAELPDDAKGGDKYILTTKVGNGNTRYTLVEYNGSDGTWIQKLLTTGNVASVVGGDVWKLNADAPERILDVSDYLYFYNKIYDETKNLIEDIDWEENDATNDTNQQIRLKITYKKNYGDPNESEATNPYKAKAVKYIDIDKSRFLDNAYSRPAVQDDVNKGYATAVGEPLLILVMTTGDHVTISLKDSLNIYDPVDTPSIDMDVTDWTGNPSTSYKVSGNVRIATTQDKTDAISLHILNSTEKGLYSTLHTTNTNSITLTPNHGAAGSQKSLTADLNIDNNLNNNSDVLLTIGTAGLSAKIIWGEYD